MFKKSFKDPDQITKRPVIHPLEEKLEALNVKARRHSLNDLILWKMPLNIHGIEHGSSSLQVQGGSLVIERGCLYWTREREKIVFYPSLFKQSPGSWEVRRNGMQAKYKPKDMQGSELEDLCKLIFLGGHVLGKDFERQAKQKLMQGW